MVVKMLNSNNIQLATRDIARGLKVIDIRQSTRDIAINDIKAIFKHVVMEYGLPNLSNPRLAPLSPEFVMRALVMFRCIYKYEVLSKIQNLTPTIIKGGAYDGIEVRAPGREDLCGKNGGLIVETYKALNLESLGYEASCGGTVGVLQAAHLLAEAGLIFERYETQIRGLEDQLDLVETYKKAKTPYALTDVGRILAFWLFGDHTAVIRTNGINNSGYSGVRPITQNSEGIHSGWLIFLELDYPTSSDSDNMDETLFQIDVTENTKSEIALNKQIDTAAIIKINQSEITSAEIQEKDPDIIEAEIVDSKNDPRIFTDISETLMKLADTMAVDIEEFEED